MVSVMDGKQGKLSTFIMGPHPRGIKRVEPVTNNMLDKLTSDSRPIELTLRTTFHRDDISNVSTSF
jgi:hypothetical protein